MQPPLRGCVLKLHKLILFFILLKQPPLRGCVLKRQSSSIKSVHPYAAASARLCVETFFDPLLKIMQTAAASARLCVETAIYFDDFKNQNAAASARLCVETAIDFKTK